MQAILSLLVEGENVFMKLQGSEVAQKGEIIRRIFYNNDGFHCKDVKTHYFKRYILDNKKNEQLIDKLITEKGIKLMIAPTGTGKSKSLIQRAEYIVSNDKDAKVILALPWRMLALQQGKMPGVKTLIGGDEFEIENAQIIATTYEKIADIKYYVEYQKSINKKSKFYLIIDESHILIMHNVFRRDAISNIIKSIEENVFDSVLLTTATAQAMSLFRADKIVEFYSPEIKPAMNRIEIIQTDDVVTYLKQLDLSKEFPLVRLNDKKLIEELIAANPSYARLTSEDKNTDIYKDLVEYSKIEQQNKKGILSTSLIEAGLNILDYPSNMTMIAAFADNNICDDSIEQFLNRARRTDTRHIECAKIVLQKAKKAILTLVDEKDNVLCEFKDVKVVKENLVIQDTNQLNNVAEGDYFIRVQGYGKNQKRRISILSSGITEDTKYCKDSKPIILYGVGFLNINTIVKANYRQAQNFKDTIQSYVIALEECREKEKQMYVGNKHLDDYMVYRENVDNNHIEVMCKALIDTLGELKECISYQNGKIVVDVRVLFLISYSQFQRQYYWHIDELKREMEARMGVPVEVIQIDNVKEKHCTYNQQNIWDGIENLREQVICDEAFYKSFIENVYTNYLADDSQYKKVIEELRKYSYFQKLIEPLDKMKMEHDMILKVLIASKSKAKITQFKNAYQLIIGNKRLVEFEKSKVGDVSVFSRKIGDKLQVVIYDYLTKKNQSCYVVNDTLVKEIIMEYKNKFPLGVKMPTERMVKAKIKQMYKIKDKKSIKNELRLNVNDIFKIVKSDYE